MSNIHWFPGHMKKATNKINDNIRLVDVVIILLDARAPFSFINDELDRMCTNKLKLIVLSKVDLADKSVLEKQILMLREQYNNVISINNNDVNSKKIICQAITQMGEAKRQKELKKGMKPQPIRAMVIGVPNVGKSSLINRITNKSSTAVANKPALTRGAIWIKVNNEFELLDTPGVLPTSYQNEQKAMNLALLGSIDDNVLPTTEMVIYLINYLKDNYPHSLSARFGIEEISQYEFVMETICKKRGLMRSGNYDFERAETLFLKEFRQGLFGPISLEKNAKF